MIGKIAYSIVFVLILFVTGGFLLPHLVHVERSIEIERPASTVFTILNSYDSFTTWSPWAERDPDARYEYSGPVAGVGARMSWNGDPRLVGSGWQEIIASQPFSRVEMSLDFEQQGMADTYFQIDSLDTGRRVRLTWGFDTNLTEGQGIFGGLLARYFGLFFDKWIGRDYEQGLAKLKVFAESLPATDFADLDVEIVWAEPLDILFIPADSGHDLDDLSASLAAAFQTIIEFMAQNDLEMAAQPMAITRNLDDRGYEFDAAIPVAMKEVELGESLRAGKSPEGPAVKVVHRGSYAGMAPSYEKLAAYMTIRGFSQGAVSWEHYISGPGEVPEDELVTHIYVSIDDDS